MTELKHLLIVGAGGFGREMFAAAREAVGYGTVFDVKGFLDDRADALADFAGYPAILGTPGTYEPQSNDVFITALGSIAARRRCVALLEQKGAVFQTIIHRTAICGPNVTVGAGSFLAPHVTLTADVTVGCHTCVFHNTSIGHDTRLGDYAHVYAQCAIGGGVRIESGASVYPGAVVVPRRTIGADAVVGAGAVVLLNVAAGTRVFGNPAHVLADEW